MLNALNDRIVSLIRVGAAALGGVLLTWLLRLGVHLDSAQVVSFLTAAGTGLYYYGVRLLETKLPVAGWLLIIKKVVTDVENAVPPAPPAAG